MSKESLSTVLWLIDEWLLTLADDQLNDQCRRSGSDFMTFMKSRKVKARYWATLIIDATGYDPALLHTVDDANLLRAAIYAYEASIQSIQYGEPIDRTLNHFWRDL